MNNKEKSFSDQIPSISNGLDKIGIVQINSGILTTTTTSPGKEYHRKTQLEKSTFPETIIPRFTEDVAYTETSNDQTELVIRKVINYRSHL